MILQPVHDTGLARFEDKRVCTVAAGKRSAGSVAGEGVVKRSADDVLDFDDEGIAFGVAAALGAGGREIDYDGGPDRLFTDRSVPTATSPPVLP